MGAGFFEPRIRILIRLRVPEERFRVARFMHCSVPIFKVQVAVGWQAGTVAQQAMSCEQKIDHYNEYITITSQHV